LCAMCIVCSCVLCCMVPLHGALLNSPAL
jgi:hypothetical protein